jgi:DNA-directed RNA polymerase specialized sigma24 family protein
MTCIAGRVDPQGVAPSASRITHPEISPEPMGVRNFADALERLPLLERAALFFRDVRQLPLDEVARQLGCSVRAARIHIAQGRIRLLKQLQTR